jgi:N-acylneuraminate cytidylyltransferase
MYRSSGARRGSSEASAEVIAIIPARGGSKGIPNKNIRPVAGIPLLAHSITHALRTPEIKRVIVSTDDQAIARVAKDWGAEVIWRPREISDDTSPSEAALLHVLDQLQEAEGYTPSLVVFLQATSPLRREDDIQNSIDTLIRERADSLFSACPVHGFVWRDDGDGVASVTYDHRSRPRRQDTNEHLVENGSIYVFKPWVIRESNNRLGGKIAVYRMDALDSFQVDEPGDLEIMERLFETSPHRLTETDLSGIRLLVLDFDGVLTDNHVTVDQYGLESVRCHRGDGWGIARLKESGVEVIVLSTETNPIVGARCAKLGIHCIQGSRHKLGELTHLAEQLSLSRDEIAYVGNDVNDLECMEWVGLPIAVADAESEIRSCARIITARPGGHGAVREVADAILLARDSKGLIHT